MPSPAFPKSLEPLNLISNRICHISYYFSLHLNANHTSPFLPVFSPLIMSETPPVPQIVFSVTCSLAAEPVFREEEDTLQEHPQGQPLVISLPLFSDLKCCLKISNVVTSEPLMIGT